MMKKKFEENRTEKQDTHARIYKKNLQNISSLGIDVWINNDDEEDEDRKKTHTPNKKTN